MAQLLKVYSDNAPPGVEPFIARIVIPEDGTQMSFTTFQFNDLRVDWGDGTVEDIPNPINSTTTRHTYTDAGEYLVKIWGWGKRLQAVGYSVEIIQWGDQPKTNIQMAENVTRVPNYLPKYCTDTSYMFESYYNIFNGPEVLEWDVSHVTNMSRMFGGSKFNQPIGIWDVSSVTDMSLMFSSSSFDQDLSGWNTSNVTTMHGMFYGSVFNNRTDGWDTRNVTDMGEMFSNCIHFNQPLSHFDTSNVTNMSRMFYRAYRFNQPIGGWDVSKVTDFSRMFCVDVTGNIPTFNQDIGDWDVSSAINMSRMFSYDLSITPTIGAPFNQDLGRWNTSNVMDMSFMFKNCFDFEQDLSRWCVSKIKSKPNNFGGKTLWPAALQPQWGTCPSNP